MGKRIKAIRQEKNMSREEFAKKLNVSIYTVANYEQGQRGSNVNVLNKIADALEVSVAELMESKPKVYDLTDKLNEKNSNESELTSEELKNLFNLYSKMLGEKLGELEQNAANAMIEIGLYTSLNDEMEVLKDASDEQIENILNSLGRYLKFELYELKNAIENNKSV